MGIKTLSELQAMNKNLRFSHKILLAAALIVTLTFASFTLYNDYMQRGAIRKDLDSYLQEMGSVTANNIQTWLNGRSLLIENLTQNIALNTDMGNITQLLEQNVMATAFVAAFLGSSEGNFIIRPDANMPADFDPRMRDWYKSAQRSNAPVLTEPYVDVGTGKLVVSIVQNVFEEGLHIGAVGGDLSLQMITDTLNELDFGGMGYAFLVSADGKILVHPDTTLAMKSLAEAYPTDTPFISSDFSEVNVDGKTHIVTFTPIKGLSSVNWYIGLSVDKDKAFSMLSQFRYSAIIATVIAVAIIIALLGVLIRVLIQPLHIMTRAMEGIADGEGDLTKRLTIQNRDEFGMLGTAFNRFVERIHGSIREVSSATEQVNEVALRVVTASNSSIHNSDQQASRTSSVAAAINQLAAAAQEIARNAAQASNQASDARSLAEDGQQVVDRSIVAMNQLSSMLSASSRNIESLNSKTVNIGQILEVITSISQQTNLLALNAAIEAARAGEAGRGFAVVADEVRNLAHRTQESAQQVQTMIEELQVGARESVSTMSDSQRHSQDSVDIANLAGERLCSVTQRIGEIDGMNQSVATATEEQTAVVESINVDITEINTLNQEGVENLQSTLRACSDLEQQAARLKQLVGSFRI
jgi:methyl-accepting chemotaxis protein